MKKIKKMQTNLKKTKKYYAVVIRLDNHSSTCLVIIDTNTVPLLFPSSIIMKSGLSKGDHFYWTPTDDGSISESNIEIIKEEPLPSPEELNFDFEEIRKLGKKS